MQSHAWRSLELKASLAAVGSVVVVAATLGAGWARAQGGAAAAPAVPAPPAAESHYHDMGHGDPAVSAPAVAAAPAPAAAAQAPEAALSGSPNPFAERFPNLVLRTHEGKTVRFYDDLLKGKIVIINFMYAQCKGKCPGITQNLVKVQKLLGDRMGKDVWFYSLTLEPEEDSPAVLADYAKRFGTGPGWLFLTGNPEDLETLRQNLGFAWSDPELDADLNNHVGTVKMGNEPRGWWGATPGLSDPRQIARLLVWMAPEAGQEGTIGHLPGEGGTVP